MPDLTHCVDLAISIVNFAAAVVGLRMARTPRCKRKKKNRRR